MERLAIRWIRWLPLGYLVFGLAWVLLSDYVLARVFTGDEAQMLVGSSLKGVAFVVLTTALIHLALVIGLPTDGTTLAPAPGRLRNARGPIIAVLLLLALIAACTYMVVDRQIESIRVDSGSEIENAAALRAAHVEGWYRGHLSALEDEVLSPFTGPAVNQWITQPSAELDRKIDRRLEALRNSGNWLGVSLFTAAGRVLKTTGGYAAPDAALLDAMTRAVTERRTQTTGLRQRTGTSRLAMDLVAPLFDGDDPDAVVVALLVASDDAGNLLEGLGPQMQGHKRIDAALVRPTGDKVQLVTVKPEQGRMPAAPVILVSRMTGAAARALSGTSGAFEGTGFHGQPVIAAGVPARGTPWLVIVTRDLSIITNQVLKLLTQAIGLAVLSVSMAVTLVLLWWRAERLRTALELQRSAEHALEMEARLGWASDFANDAILLMDTDGRILDANERARASYGYSREEFLGRNIRDLRRGDPASLAVLEQQLTRTLGDGSLIFETTHLRKDGTTFPVEVSARRVEHAGRTYVQSIVRDITERVRHQELIRRSEERYRALFEAVPHPICVIDPETQRILLVNSAAETLLGYSHDEPLGLTLRDVVAPHEFERMQQHLAANRHLVRYEAGVWQYRAKDGRLVDVDVVSHVVVLNGRTAMLALGTDVTDRIRAERAMASSEARYRALFDSNPHPMWVFDTETLRFLIVNDAAMARYGYSNEEFLAMTIADIRPAEAIDALHDHLNMARPPGLRESGIWKHRRKDGSLLDVEISSHAFDYGGRPARLVLANDVTNRVEAERALRASEERYRKLFEEVHDGILQVNNDNRFLDANAEATRMLGYERDELLAIGLPDILDESEHARLASFAGGVGEGTVQVPQKRRWLHRRRDGTRFVAEVGSRRLADGTIISTIHDLTEILAAQRLIERQRDMYALLSECNQSAARVSGRDELFNDFVRLAVDKGHFDVAWIGEIRGATGVWPVASAGDDRGLLADARRGFDDRRADEQRSPDEASGRRTGRGRERHGRRPEGFRAHAGHRQA